MARVLMQGGPLDQRTRELGPWTVRIWAPAAAPDGSLGLGHYDRALGGDVATWTPPGAPYVPQPELAEAERLAMLDRWPAAAL